MEGMVFHSYQYVLVKIVGVAKLFISFKEVSESRYFWLEVMFGKCSQVDESEQTNLKADKIEKKSVKGHLLLEANEILTLLPCQSR